MKLRYVLISAALTGMFAAPASGQGRDTHRYQGDYGMDCKKGSQCWWEVRPRNGGDPESVNYDFTFVVADRMDASKVKCTIKGEGFEDKLAIGVGLVAYMGPKEIPVHMRASNGGSLFAFTPSGAKVGCQGSEATGGLSPIGD